MTHFGIICPSATGHLNPMCALGREIQRRGHRVTLFGVPDVRKKIVNAGLDSSIIGEDEFPPGTMEQLYEQLGKMRGLAGVKFTINLIKKGTIMLFQEAPNALKSVGIDVLLVDQVSPAGGTIAQFLNLPFIVVCNALLLNQEASVPPAFTQWNYHRAWWAYMRNNIGYFLSNCMAGSIYRAVKKQRRHWKLSAFSKPEDMYSSSLAQICQLPIEFDFPRKNLPKGFHYTGPLQEPSGEEPVSFPSFVFPFEKLTHQPLIYASLGTLQNRDWNIFYCIAEACAGLDAQLVISLGDPNNRESGQNLPGSPLVVPYAPHWQLIKRADLIITHSGLNTVLGALSCGVPMVAIPITNEQPGIAARLAAIGVGEVIPASLLSSSKLREAIQKVLKEDSYKKNASRLQASIRKAGGVKRAADIIEKVLSTENRLHSD